MMSRSVAVGLLAVGCLTAAAGGSYLAIRHNAAEVPAQAFEQIAVAPSPGVTETEAVVLAPEPDAVPAPEPVVPARVERPEPRRERAPSTPSAAARPPRPAARPQAVAPFTVPAPMPAVATVEPTAPVLDPLPRAEVPTVPEPEYLMLVTVPASAVIGLEVETTVSTEQAEVEDRVDARVTRDVYADGQLAIPAGSRVTGAVTLVERGGKLKDRARLGVRFHTLVLADGRQMPLRTETIYREGDSPGQESSRKIGGAAVGGAVLGAILGGGKGAVTGATVGAAGGTAVVMAGGRNPAILASGSMITARLASPVTLEVDR